MAKEESGKLHPEVRAAVARLSNPSLPAGANETRFVRQGKAEVTIWLHDTSAQALEQLKQLGVEVIAAPS